MSLHLRPKEGSRPQFYPSNADGLRSVSSGRGARQGRSDLAIGSSDVDPFLLLQSSVTSKGSRAPFYRSMSRMQGRITRTIFV